jgi:hypothetical protein
MVIWINHYNKGVTEYDKTLPQAREKSDTTTAGKAHDWIAPDINLSDITLHHVEALDLDCSRLFLHSRVV